MKEFVSRWLMRSMEAGRVLQIPLLGVTALSTLTTALKGTFLEQYTLTILLTFTFGSLVFVWAYDESEVLNLQNREKQDRSDNFAGPGFAMGNLMRARQLAAVANAMKNGADEDEIYEELEKTTRELLQEYRNGIDLEEVYGQR